MITRWKSEPIAEADLPDRGLIWYEETPNPDYRVRIGLTVVVDGVAYRRLMFPGGTTMYSRLVYEKAGV